MRTGRPFEGVKRTCGWCGVEIRVAQHKARRSNLGKFCSRNCYEQGRIGQKRKAYQGHEPVSVQCPVCAEWFSIRKSSKQRYCSSRCAGVAQYHQGSKSLVLSDLDSAYIAGLVDGEGSIFCYWRNGRIAIRLTVSNTSMPALYWLAEITGVGDVSVVRAASERHKPGGRWQCNSEAATSVIEQIQPYLRIKVEQAALAIEIQRRLLTTERYEKDWQRDCSDQLRSLNKRGPS